MGDGVVDEMKSLVGYVLIVAYLWKGVAASAWAMAASGDGLAGCRGALVAAIGTVGAMGCVVDAGRWLRDGPREHVFGRARSGAALSSTLAASLGGVEECFHTVVAVRGMVVKVKGVVARMDGMVTGSLQ
jgi:hypothetical protein